MNDEELVKQQVRTWASEATSSDSVTVNGVVITARAINIESANFQGGSIVERQHQAAVALVIRELFRQRAAELGLPTPGDEIEEDALIDQLLEREATIPEPDETACRRYFDNHRNTFRSPDLFEVSHILIAADPRDEDARAAAKEEARRVIRLLADEPTRFAELATALSDCPSKHAGGNLGQIGKGQTVPEFEQVLFRMQQGESSRSPVESRYGFHVMYVQRRVDGVQLDFDTVREQIAGYLRENVRRQAISQYLRILIGRAELSGIELEGSETPLVQ